METLDIQFSTADEVYDRIVRELPVIERLRLVERISHELTMEAGAEDHSMEHAELLEWRMASANTLKETWDNDEDAVYDRL